MAKVSRTKTHIKVYLTPIEFDACFSVYDEGVVDREGDEYKRVYDALEEGKPHREHILDNDAQARATYERHKKRVYG